MENKEKRIGYTKKFLVEVVLRYIIGVAIVFICCKGEFSSLPFVFGAVVAWFITGWRYISAKQKYSLVGTHTIVLYYVIIKILGSVYVGLVYYNILIIKYIWNMVTCKLVLES